MTWILSLMGLLIFTGLAFWWWAKQPAEHKVGL